MHIAQEMSSEDLLEVSDHQDSNDDQYIEMISADDEYEGDDREYKRKMGRIPRNYHAYIEESNRRIAAWRKEMESIPSGCTR